MTWERPFAKPFHRSGRNGCVSLSIVLKHVTQPSRPAWLFFLADVAGIHRHIRIEYRGFRGRQEAVVISIRFRKEGADES